MQSTFTLTLADGRTLKLVGTYQCYMSARIIDSDGDLVDVGRFPNESGLLEMYLDGERIASAINGSWNLIDVPDRPGIRKIYGLPIGFTKSEDAQRYENWVKDLISSGTTEGVVAYRADKAEKEYIKQLEHAKSIIKKAESQIDIPDKAEAKRRMNQYNDIHNEGGDGFVPYIYCREEYEYALDVVNAEKVK